MWRILLLLPLLSSCAYVITRADTYELIRVERVGAVEVEVWRNNRTRVCERRIFLDTYYFSGDTPCDYRTVTK